jgi:hypothetical protein
MLVAVAWKGQYRTSRTYAIEVPSIEVPSIERSLA